MASPPGPLRWFASLVRPFAGQLSLVALSLGLSSGLVLIFPWLMGRSIDAAFVEKSLHVLNDFAVTFAVLLAIWAVLEFCESWLLGYVSARILRDLRAKLHSHFLTLPPAFYDARRTGDLLSRLNSDVSNLGNLLTKELVSALVSALSLTGALAILFAVHFQLTVVMVATFPPIVATAVLFARRFEKLSEREQDTLAESNVVAEEGLSGIRTVQAFVREPEERARYGATLAAFFAIGLRSTFAWSVFHAGVKLLGFGALGFVLWYGLKLATQGRITNGQLASFQLYTMIVGTSVGSLTGLYGRLVSARGATARIREILATAPAIADAPGAREIGRPRGDVRFENVAFQYASTDRPALSGVTLSVARGEMLAIVGPSGAGKTTLASLLLRFHDPASGVVSVDGHDLRSLRLADLRAAIGFVPQDVFLFGGTIAENIGYGRPGATEAEIVAAAEAAHAAEFVGKLPKQYATPVGERGVRLSAGERQRIAIARVFLKDPAIVVLDEATSALDAESESLVQKAFERLFQGRTTLVIAHRLATVRRATNVAVLENGKVAELGKHEELLAKGGLYRRLCELQMLA